MSSMLQQAIDLLDQKEPLLEAYMKKKSPRGLVKFWQRRYFVLYEDVLEYFEKSGDSKPLGIIPIQDITSVEQLLHKNKGCRVVVCVGDVGDLNYREFHLISDTTQTASLWVSHVGKLVEKYYSSPSSPELNHDTRGKYWKNVTHINKARRASIAALSWGEDEEEEGNGFRSPFSSLSSPLSSPFSSPSRSPTPSCSLEHLEGDSGVTSLPFSLVKKLDISLPSCEAYQVKERETETAYIMHVFPRESESHTSSSLSLFEAVSDLSHSSLPQRVFRGTTSDTHFSVFECEGERESEMERESLFSLLRQHRRFSEDVVRFIGAQLVSLLSHLHSKGLKFFSLSPEQLSLSRDGYISVKDLLLSLSLTSENLIPPHDQHINEYHTPEYLLNNNRQTDTHASDWWRLGICLYELLVGVPPFRSSSVSSTASSTLPATVNTVVEEVEEKIMNHTTESLLFPPFVSEEAACLIRSLLSVDTSSRLGGGEEDGREVMNHIWFESMDWSCLEKRQMVPPRFICELLSSPSLFGEPIEKCEGERRRTGEREHKVNVHVVEAIGVPSLSFYNEVEPTSYCRVACDSLTLSSPQEVPTSPSLPLSSSLSSTFNQFFELDTPLSLSSSSSSSSSLTHHGDDDVLQVDVCSHEDHFLSDPVVGTCSLSLSEIKENTYIDSWFQIIGRDCLSYGHLHLRVLYSPRLNCNLIGGESQEWDISFSELFAEEEEEVESLSLSPPFSLSPLM